MSSTAGPDGGAVPARAARVRRLEPVDRRGRRVRVVLGADDGRAHEGPAGALDGGEETLVLELALEVVERAGLGAGDPVDAALRARLLDADLRWRARDAALAFLAHRPRSRQETARRLRARGFPGAVIEECLDALVEEGLLDDGAFADALVRERLRRNPRGSARLRDELARRGLPPAMAAEAVERGFGAAGTSEESVAIDTALRWLERRGEVRRALAGEEPDGSRFSRRFGVPSARAAAIRRLTVFLRGRGFGSEAVRAAVVAAERAARAPD